MNRSTSFADELRATLRLAAPLVLAQLVQMGIYTTDVLMLGRYSAEALAASALAVNLLAVFNFTGTGLVGAAAPLIAAALGERRNAVRDVRRSFRSAIHAALLYALPAMILLWNGERVLLAFGQDPRLAAPAGHFLRILMWTLAPNLLLVVFRAMLAAAGRPGAALVVMVAGLAVNAAGNWLLIFGHLGAPRLGLTGAALASVATVLTMTLLLALYVAFGGRTRRFYLFGRLHRPDRARLRRIFRVGVPIGLTTAFEVSFFSAAIYLMGWIDTASVAAHAIALQVASIAFMVPFGLSQATVVRVGLGFGARDSDWVTRAGRASLVITMAVMSFSAMLMWAIPRPIAGLFLEARSPAETHIVDLTVQFLAVAALFQLFDGAQVVGAAMLRGLHDTRVPMLFALIGYWLIGLGGGYWLAFHAGLRGVGIWWGFALGLGVVAVLMLTRWRMRDRLGLVS